MAYADPYGDAYSDAYGDTLVALYLPASVIEALRAALP